MASTTVFSKAQEAANFLQGRLDPKLQKPKVAIVCGSGLGGLADAVHEQPRTEIHYSLIPHFPQSTGTIHFLFMKAFVLYKAITYGGTVQGHAGKLLFGFLGAQTPVVLMVGRLQSAFH
jgi:purine-nucleoside phosphorylase